MTTTEKNTKNNMYERLAQCSNDELIGVIQSLCLDDAAHKKLEKIVARFDQSSKEISASIKKTLKLLSTALNKYIYDPDLFANTYKHASELLSMINDLAKHSPTAALQEIQIFINEMQSIHEIYHYYDHDQDKLHDLLKKAANYLPILIIKMREVEQIDLEELAEIVFQCYYRYYDELTNFITAVQNTLEPAGLELLQEKFWCRLENKDKLSEKAIEEILISDNHLQVQKDRGIFDKNIYRAGLQEIADLKNDVDLFIRAKKIATILLPQDRIAIASRLIKHQRAKEAIKYLSSIKPEIYTSREHDQMRALKIEAFILLDDAKKAKNERIEWFYSRLQAHIYQQVLAEIHDHEEMLSFEKQAKQAAFEFENLIKSAEFFHQIEAFSDLAKLIEQRFVELKFDDNMMHKEIRTIAERLEKPAPLLAVKIYRRLLEPVVNEAKSKYYKYAALDFYGMCQAAQHVKDWQDLVTHDEYLKAFQVAHKRKKAFWEACELTADKKQKEKIKQAKKALKNKEYDEDAWEDA